MKYTIIKIATIVLVFSQLTNCKNPEKIQKPTITSNNNYKYDSIKTAKKDTVNLYADLDKLIDTISNKNDKNAALEFKKYIQSKKYIVYCELSNFQINGIPIYKFTRQNIIDNFGKPLKEYEPNYECGFHSSEQQGKTYILLKYKEIDFIGNEEEGYLAEEIDLNLIDNSDTSITLYGTKISNKTTVEDLEKIFKKDLEFSENDESIILQDFSDDNFSIEFKNGFASKITYFSPC